MQLTDVQKKYGLTLWPSWVDGRLVLRGRDGSLVGASSDEHEIHKLAQTYVMGATAWVGEGYPIEEGEG